MSNPRSYYSKDDYAKSAQKEKEIAHIIVSLIKDQFGDDENITVVTSACGKGAGSSATVLSPIQMQIEIGTPDRVFKPSKDTPYGDKRRIYAEVAGSDYEFNSPVREYYIAKRKIEFQKKYPDQEIYYVLLYQYPWPKLVVLKLDPDKDYKYTKFVKGEAMAVFTDEDDEVIGYDLGIVAGAYTKNFRELSAYSE